MLVALAAALAALGPRGAPLQLPLRREAARAGPTRRRCSRRRRARRGRSRARRAAARRVVHGGRSMGGRIASQVVAAGRARGRARVPRLPAPSAGPAREAPRGPPARDRGADAVRAGHARRLRAARTCWTRSSRASAPRAERHDVAAADHSFGVLKRSGRTPRGRRGRGPADRARLARPPRALIDDSKETLLIAASLALLLTAAPAAPIGPGTRFDPRIPTLEQVVGHATGAGDHPARRDRRVPRGAGRGRPRPRARLRVRAQRGGPAALDHRDRQPGADRASRRGEEGPAGAGRPALALRGRRPTASCASCRRSCGCCTRSTATRSRPPTPRSPWRTTCSRRRTTRRPRSPGARRSSSSTRSRTPTAARGSSRRTARRRDRRPTPSRSPRSTTSRGRAAARTTTSST